MRIGFAHAALTIMLTGALGAGAMPASAQIIPKALTRQPDPKPDEQTIADAYVYLLGRALVIRQELNDLRESGYNVIKYPAPGASNFVNPNSDIAFLEAWIAVDPWSPALLEIPEIKGRYYTVQILNEWGEVVTNINERTFPSKPFGKFALVTPGSTAWIPPDAVRIHLHSNKAKLIGRVEFKDDRESAFQLQRQFRLTTIGRPVIKPPPAIPMFDNRHLAGVAIFDNVNAKLASAHDTSPVAAEMQQKIRSVAAYLATDKQARAAIDRSLREKVIPEFREYAASKTAPDRDHWIGGGQMGNYGRDFRLRTAVNFAGIWANTTDEVVHFLASRDAKAQPLNGSRSYVIHFPANKLPQSAVNSYWSVILVGIPDYRPVSNPLNRFTLDSHSPLQNEADGSLKIAIGPKPVAGVPESNWLPSQEGKPFALTFRTYVPKDVVKRGEWQPAAVTFVGPSEGRAVRP